MVNDTEMKTTIKFLCSYGGKIVPRSTDGQLRYAGGITRVLAVDRSICYTELMVKLGGFCGFSVNLRCQLPNGDLETFVSIKSDEDLANIIEEYDRAWRASASGPSKIRAILSPIKSPIKSPKQISPPQSICSSLLSPKLSSSPVSDRSVFMKNAGLSCARHCHLQSSPIFPYDSSRFSHYRN